MFKRGVELRPIELGPAEDAARELAAGSGSSIASRRDGWREERMMPKKKGSTDMQAKGYQVGECGGYVG